MSMLSKEQTKGFAKFLYRQAGPPGRANLAELRRAAVSPEHDFRDLRILGPLLADNNRVFDAQRIIAGLFALYAPKFWQPDNTLRLPRFAPEEKRRSLGASLRQLRGQLKGGEESLDKRFAALLDTAREDLVVPLRGLLQRLATSDSGVPVDFARLLTDLVYWEYDQPDGRSVRRTWARDYWQPAALIGAEAEAPAAVITPASNTPTT